MNLWLLFILFIFFPKICSFLFFFFFSILIYSSYWIHILPIIENILIYDIAKATHIMSQQKINLHICVHVATRRSAAKQVGESTSQHMPRHGNSAKPARALFFLRNTRVCETRPTRTTTCQSLPPPKATRLFFMWASRFKSQLPFFFFFSFFQKISLILFSLNRNRKFINVGLWKLRYQH